MSSRGFAVDDLMAFLRGRWQLAREMTDPNGAWLGTFTGEARFTDDGELLRYHESGALRLGDQRRDAYRTLWYRSTGATSCTVEFEHGGHFHELDLARGYCEVQHPCAADLYHGQFRVHDHDRWVQRWRASGPTKNYQIVSDYSRLSEHRR